MTVETTTSKAGPYVGAGTVGPFPVPFRFLDASHLQVIRTDPNGNSVTLALGSDYSVQGAGQTTGAVTLTAALPSSFRLTVLRNVPATQEADYVQNDAFPAESHERALDKLTMLAQQQGERIGRALVVPETDAPVSLVLPSVASRARRYLSFDELGRPVSTTFDIDTVQQASQAAQDAATNAKESEIAAAGSADDAQASADFAREQSDFVARQVAATTPTVVRFSGDGVATVFELPSVPGAEENTDVFLSGVYQQKNTYDVPAGSSSLVFAEAPPEGVENIEVKIAPSVMLLIGDAQDISFVGPDGIKRSVGNYLRDGLSRATLSFPDLASAEAAAATLPDGQMVEVRTPEGHLPRYKVQGGVLSFLYDLDQLRIDLLKEDGSGASRINTRQPYTGATTRQLSQKLGDIISVKDFGVSESAAAADNLAGMNEALTAFGIAGGKLDSPVGTLNFSGGVTITAPVSISGKGGVFSAFNPQGLTSAQDFFTFKPSTDVTGMRLSNFAVHNPTNGSRAGRAAVFIDTQMANKNVSLMKVSGVLVGESGGPAFYHLNDYLVNINGGFFASHLEGNSFKGGIKLENTGDSNNITHNILTGSNIGVQASFVPGASLLEIQANNITNAGGAVRLENGSRPRIIGNNIENYAAGAASKNNAAVVNLTGNSGTIFGGVIKENLVSAFGTSDATTLIRVRNTQGLLIEDNVLLNGSGAAVGIDIGPDCANVRVGANTFGPGVTTPVLDNGRGTMGVLKTATLENGWVEFSSSQSPLQFIKSLEGIVHVSGIIKGGATTNGTLLTTFPEGFRPAKVLRFMAQVLNAGTPQMVELSLETTGALRLNYALTNAQLTVNFSFPAQYLGNAASAE